ncbi:MAG: hypothetical protein ACOZEN_03120 [Thermodesulfobacteriota bacterium]
MNPAKKLTGLAGTAALVLTLGIAAPSVAQSHGGMDGHGDDSAAKHFKFMDKNKDGVLEEKEFKMMGKDYKEQFSNADADKDGKVTQDEYKKFDDKYKPMSKMKM